MNCALSTSRGFFYGLNVIFGLMGLFLLSYTLYSIELGRENPKISSARAILQGIFMILGFIFGCFGIHRTSVRFMTSNVIIVGLVLLLQLIALCKLYSLDLEAFEKPSTSLAENAWRHRQLRPGDMEALEIKFRCCGLHGYRDYLTDNQWIPSSCYSDDNMRYLIGCWEQLSKIAHLEVRKLKTLLWIVAVFEGSLLAFGIVVANNFRKLRRITKTYSEMF